jgi:hypothetical protein
MESLVDTLDSVVNIVDEHQDNAELGARVRQYLAPSGSLESLRESCAEVRAYSGRNYLPLLWRHFKAHRSVLLRLARALAWGSTTQSQTLLSALEAVFESESLHREWLNVEIDLSFASDRWRKLVCRPREKGAPTNRRYLELCVLSCMAKELRSGDLCVAGSDAFADYRDYLLPWNECEKRLPVYCEKFGMPDSGAGFVAHLRKWLSDAARQLDERFPEKSEHVIINKAGEVVVRRTVATIIPESAVALHKAMVKRMPVRNLLDKFHPVFRPAQRQRSEDPQCCRAVSAHDFRDGVQSGPDPGSAPHGGQDHAAYDVVRQPPAPEPGTTGDRAARTDRALPAAGSAQTLGRWKDGGRRRHAVRFLRQ